MSESADILVIDDDKFAQKMIRKALAAGGYDPRTASSGEEGLREAHDHLPDIIILDVEMPGLSGYEVCNMLRQDARTLDVPVVFLSSHSSLRERMQGYEVGADDYLVKPFDPEHLLAKIKVLIKYRQQQKELHAQYQLAQKTAMIALSGSSELGVAMHFVEKTYSYGNFDTLAHGLFHATDQFGLSCCLQIHTEQGESWYGSGGEGIKPLEQELIEMADKEKRFTDFGSRTIVNFQHTSLLVRNMPLDDLERYGRIKDILPVLLSAIETKMHALRTDMALESQSKDLLKSFSRIKTSLYYLAKTLLANQEESAKVMKTMTDELNYDLLRMGLEEDQEEYLLNRIDNAIDEAAQRIDASAAIANSLTLILQNLREVIKGQEELVAAFSASHSSSPIEQKVEDEGDIELF